MKAIKRSLIGYIISAVFFVLLFIALVVLIISKYVIRENLHNTYQEDNFMIDIDPKINKKLDKLDDANGLYSDFNIVNITNNDQKIRKYQIILSPLSNNEEDIRVSIDNSLIRNLSNFDKNNNNYILGEFELEPSYSNVHQIRMWQDIKSKLDKINVDFKITVNIFKEGD